MPFLADLWSWIVQHWLLFALAVLLVALMLALVAVAALVLSKRLMRFLFRYSKQAPPASARQSQDRYMLRGDRVEARPLPSPDGDLELGRGEEEMWLYSFSDRSTAEHRAL